MGGYDVPQKATAGASARDASVHVRFTFAFSRIKLCPRPMLVAMTPDDAMALSIELQNPTVSLSLHGVSACAVDET
jgi:hypothetical protein